VLLGPQIHTVLQLLLENLSHAQRSNVTNLQVVGPVRDTATHLLCLFIFGLRDKVQVFVPIVHNVTTAETKFLIKRPKHGRGAFGFRGAVPPTAPWQKSSLFIVVRTAKKQIYCWKWNDLSGFNTLPWHSSQCSDALVDDGGKRLMKAIRKNLTPVEPWVVSLFDRPSPFGITLGGESGKQQKAARDLIQVWQVRANAAVKVIREGDECDIKHVLACLDGHRVAVRLIMK
jgi:hypothetical protein